MNMKKLFTALFALSLIAAPISTIAAGTEDLECPVCFEPCFDANYNPTGPIAVLHRPQNSSQKPHAICRQCYNGLRENICPECRADIDASFVNNAAEQNNVINRYRAFKQDEVAGQRQNEDRVRREREAREHVQREQERQRQQDLQRRQAEEAARQREQQRQQERQREEQQRQQERQQRQVEEAARQREQQRQREEQRRQQERQSQQAADRIRRAEEQERYRQEEERRAQRAEQERQEQERQWQREEQQRRSQEQSANNNDHAHGPADRQVPPSLHQYMRQVSILIFLLPTLARWYVHQLARII